MSDTRSGILSRGLPAPVERVAVFLAEAGHLSDHAVAMAVGMVGDVVKVSHPLRQSVRRWQHLRMSPQEREGFANSLLARRVLAEGMLLSLDGRDVRDGAVLSAHALCETRAVKRPLALRLGGGQADAAQVTEARARLRTEIKDLDDLVEAAVGLVGEDAVPLSTKNGSTGTPMPRVVHLQNRLNSYGHRVNVDGVFGPITKESVNDFQARVGLPTTGEVDTATADALRRGKVMVAGVEVPAETPSMAPQTPSHPAPTPIGDGDPNKETDNDATQAASDAGTQPAEKDDSGTSSDKKKTTTTGGGKGVTVSVKMREAADVQEGLHLEIHLKDGRVHHRRFHEKGLAMSAKRELERRGHKVKLVESALSSSERDALPDSAFVFPKKRSYPIHDRGHAANALARSSGKPEEAAVKAAVYAKYPAMKHHVEEARGAGKGEHESGQRLERKQHRSTGVVHFVPFGAARALCGEAGSHLVGMPSAPSVPTGSGSDSAPGMPDADDTCATCAAAADVAEATSGADMPQTQLPSACPTCGARVLKSGVCQRGHRVSDALPDYEMAEAELQVADENHALSESPRTAELAATPKPFSTSTTSNWVARAGGLPNYIQQVAHGIQKSGKSESESIQIAIGRCKDWAAGGGGVSKEVQAAAAAAIAEFEAKAKASKVKTAAKDAAKDVSEAAMATCTECGAPAPEGAAVCQRGHRLLQEAKRPGKDVPVTELKMGHKLHMGGKKRTVLRVRKEKDGGATVVFSDKHHPHALTIGGEGNPASEYKARVLDESAELQEDWKGFDSKRPGGAVHGEPLHGVPAGPDKDSLMKMRQDYQDLMKQGRHAEAHKVLATHDALLTKVRGKGSLSEAGMEHRPKTGGWKDIVQGHGPSMRKGGGRTISAKVSKHVFEFHPNMMDSMHPNARVKPGDRVRITRLHGAPAPGTMGQYHIAHHETGALLGMVSGNSLRQVK